MQRNLIKKALRYCLMLMALVIAGLFLWMQLGLYLITDSTQRKMIVSEIKAAPPVPENFINVYSKVHPEEMNYSTYRCFFERVSGNYIDSPCLAAAYMFYSTIRNANFFKWGTFAIYIDNNTTRKECIQFNMHRIDFTHNNIGVEAASQYYYRKPVANLSDYEILELLVMAKNPSLYNKNRINNQPFKNAYAVIKHKYESGS